MSHLKYFRATDGILLICFLFLCFVSCCNAMGPAHHGHHHHHQNKRRAGSDTTYASLTPISQAAAASSTMSLEEARDKVEQALKVLTTVNKDLTSNPQRNTYQFQNESSIKANKQAPPLQYQNSNIAARSTNMGQNEPKAYTIPVELVEAARIVAESTSNHGLGGQGLDINAVLSKYRQKTNDTNAPPQAHRSPNGLGRPFIADTASSEQFILNMHSKRDSSTFWLTEIDQTGTSPFAPAGYKVQSSRTFIVDQLLLVKIAHKVAGLA
jgi:hypothetical protein